MRGVVDEGVGSTAGVSYRCGQAEGEEGESGVIMEVSLGGSNSSIEQISCPCLSK